MIDNPRDIDPLNSGRYIILLMGVFSIYTGFLYNDIFSKSLHLFHSGWDFPEAHGNETLPGVANGHTYPFGIDPAWHGAENGLLFTNSYKMKMSIVLGVIHVRLLSFCDTGSVLTLAAQMTFAVCLQVPNHIRFRRFSDIWTNFIPQMVFLQSIFGYLVVCIIYKWTVDWSQASTQPPSLLNMLIGMVLSPGSVDPDSQLYPGQATVQVILLLMAGVCVPWLLISKPYLQYQEMKKIQGQGYIGLGADDVPRHTDDTTLEGEEEGNGQAIVEANDEEHVSSCTSWMLIALIPSISQEQHDFSEVVVHQVIHTIEFCLGCVSHTASYLRLWALSLAHAQLSEVLWDMTLANVLGMSGVVGIIALAFVGVMWLVLTISILCVMEVRLPCGSWVVMIIDRAGNG